ncbi:hypothetical protein [Sporolactobacillus sp. KGMB 08714]|uniref:hypothetical protein n=1 Tax=Sporolactobacillus sp. KGMB 08714 TaxID=3064704 RepID=UPI002FBEBACE
MFEVSFKELQDIETRRKFQCRRRDFVSMTFGFDSKRLQKHMAIDFYCPGINSLRCFKLEKLVMDRTQTILELA